MHWDHEPEADWKVRQPAGWKACATRGTVDARRSTFLRILYPVKLMFKEFKTFIIRGNVIDLAVGLIIGAAFGKIVTSFVTDVLTPPLGKLMGRIDFSQLVIDLS